MANQTLIPVSVSRSGTIRGRKTFSLKISDDLFHGVGNERMLLDIVVKHHEVRAFMTPITMGPGARGSDRSRWAALIAESLVQADMAGAVTATLDVNQMPPWFHRLAKDCGLEPVNRNCMTAHLGPPKEKGK